MRKLLQIALLHYGQTEIKGIKHNPIIVSYFHDIGFDYINDDETPWCSAFLCWCAYKAKMEHPSSLVARKWLSCGDIITGNPQPGDIVIFWRESISSWKGHVGIFINRIDYRIYVLGGNQGVGGVNIKAYSYKYLLGYRRLHQA